MTGAAVQLSEIIAAETARPVASVVAVCTSYLHQHFGSSTAGVLFYGAGLRREITADTLLDFYVIVDDPRVALKSVMAGWAAMVLPPNVYALEIETPEGPRRAKVAVLSTRAFADGMTTFSSHLWSRFAQPAAIVYARDANARRAVIAALSAAARHMINATLPLMPTTFTTHQLWVRAMQECYRAEIRPEAPDRAEELVRADERYEAVTAAVLGPAKGGLYTQPYNTDAHKQVRLWRWRRRWGKTTNLLRLMKAAFTFNGGLDYAVDKIARHSGVVVNISDRDRRHPLLAGIRVLREAIRRGGVR